MGKKNFSQMYQTVKDQLHPKELSVKISHFSDHFDPTKDYAGVIIYHWEGIVEWYNPKIKHRGRSFYVYLVCTDNFEEDEFREAGQGRVHHTAVERIMGIDFRENKACLGGFSVRKGETNYSSVWLNMKSSTSFPIHWESDESKYLSEAEKLIVDLAVNEWKVRGKHIEPIKIPPEMDRRICGRGSGPMTPSRSFVPSSRGSAVCCPRGHPLVDLGLSQDNGWVCDGRDKPGGCKSGITRYDQTAGTGRWRCAACDYDLCPACYASEATGRPATASRPAPWQVGTGPIRSWRECSEGERVRVLPADQAEGPTRDSPACWTSDCRARCGQEGTIMQVDEDGTLKLRFDDGGVLWFATGSCVKVAGRPASQPRPQSQQAGNLGWGYWQDSTITVLRENDSGFTIELPEGSNGWFRVKDEAGGEKVVWSGGGLSDQDMSREAQDAANKIARGQGMPIPAAQRIETSHWTLDFQPMSLRISHKRDGYVMTLAPGSLTSPGRSGLEDFFHRRRGGGSAGAARPRSASLSGSGNPSSNNRSVRSSSSSRPRSGREGLDLMQLLTQGLAEHLQQQARPRSGRNTGRGPINSIPVGAWVRVKRSVQSPRYGWGGLTHDSIGCVKSVDSDGDLRISFPGRSLWTGSPDEMEVVPGYQGPTIPSGMTAGAWVRVKRSVQNPRFHWGGVNRDSVGCIRKVDSDGDLWVSFPEQKNWRGRVEEMEVVPGYQGPSQSAGFRVGAQVRLKNGVSPRYGRGEVSSRSVGTVKSITADGDLHIDFPEQNGWHGHPSDLQFA